MAKLLHIMSQRFDIADAGIWIFLSHNRGFYYRGTSIESILRMSWIKNGVDKVSRLCSDIRCGMIRC